MKNEKIVLVAEWDGWCGACAADRPLVLTRTGRQRLRTWLTGASDDSRPLLLTCRLCGTSVDVPLEADDPPVVVTAPEPVQAVRLEKDVQSEAAPQPADTTSVPVPAAELTAGRQAVATALGTLLAQRSAAAPVATPVPAPRVAQPAVPLLAPALPLQRNAPGDGLAELQLLADGIDLLSSGRT